MAVLFFLPSHINSWTTSGRQVLGLAAGPAGSELVVAGEERVAPARGAVASEWVGFKPRVTRIIFLVFLLASPWKPL